MAKGKPTGRVNTRKVGRFDTGVGLAGLTRGTTAVSTSKSEETTVNRRKYVSKQFSQGYH